MWITWGSCESAGFRSAGLGWGLRVCIPTKLPGVHATMLGLEWFRPLSLEICFNYNQRHIKKLIPYHKSTKFLLTFYKATKYFIAYSTLWSSNLLYSSYVATMHFTGTLVINCLHKPIRQYPRCANRNNHWFGCIFPYICYIWIQYSESSLLREECRDWWPLLIRILYFY